MVCFFNNARGLTNSCALMEKPPLPGSNIDRTQTTNQQQIGRQSVAVCNSDVKDRQTKLSIFSKKGAGLVYAHQFY